MIESILGIFAIAGFGFMLGVRHALDADHIATISNLVSEHKNIKKASMLGALWGIGHTVALLAVGILVLALKLHIPPSLETALEFLVGATLFFLGANAIHKALKEQLHSHKHKHKDENTQHAHFHYNDDHAHKKTFSIGVLHGLAGSAAVMLLVVATISNFFEGVLYILLFGAGTIIGMLLISTLLGIPFAAGKKVTLFSEVLKITVGIASIVFGAAIMYEHMIVLL